MTEYTKYIADDGTEFDDCGECEVYERKLKLDGMRGKLIALDINGKPVDDLRDIDRIFYLYIDSDRTAYQLDDLYDEGWPWSSGSINCAGRPRAGQFFYDTDMDHWIDIDSTKEKIKEAECYLEDAQ